MAETGATKILEKEIQEIINANLAHQQIKGKRIDSPGEDSGVLELTQDYSHLEFVSMLAPSPDWFVSTTVNLFQDNQWQETVELDLTTYDAGSDSGETLTAKDQDTTPKEPVSIFNPNLQSLGKLIITKINE